MPEVAAVGAIALDAGRLLLIRRGNPPDVGKWSLPGGRIEPGESEVDALVREMAEETGLVVEVGPLAGEVVRPGPNGVAYRIRDYLVDVVGGIAHAGDDAADVAWVPLERVAELAVTGGLLDALRGWGVLDAAIP
jgi:8-oxo-dGTP diphosphatase